MCFILIILATVYIITILISIYILTKTIKCIVKDIAEEYGLVTKPIFSSKLVIIIISCIPVFNIAYTIYNIVFYQEVLKKCLENLK